MAQRQPHKAVRLFGAAAALRNSIGSVIDPVDQLAYENELTSLHEELGEAQFSEAWDEGSALTLEQAVEYAR
jgi:hypothetical protein